MGGAGFRPSTVGFHPSQLVRWILSITASSELEGTQRSMGEVPQAKRGSSFEGVLIGVGKKESQGKLSLSGVQ